MNSTDNPGTAGGMHSEQDGPGYQPSGGRGFGYNRGGFRGRGGFPVRPGMGRGFEHGPPPGDMGRGGPWMGKENIEHTVNYIYCKADTLVTGSSCLPERGVCLRVDAT